MAPTRFPQKMPEECNSTQVVRTLHPLLTALHRMGSELCAVGIDRSPGETTENFVSEQILDTYCLHLAYHLPTVTESWIPVQPIVRKVSDMAICHP